MITFPPGFFDRADESPDAQFYDVDRFVAHIDDDAIAEVGALYRELELTGDVLDICSSWISHFETPPTNLVALGMNANELARNEAASETVVADLNVDPRLPFDEGAFEAVTCCVSVDYLTRPIEVVDEAARVLRPGGPLVITFSNRCFPTKAIRAWLGADDARRCQIVAVYFAAIDRFGPVRIDHRNPDSHGDPLFAVWAHRLPIDTRVRPATAGDQSFITDMQYEALFVPPGADPYPRSVLDDPGISRYHSDFGERPGDVGRVATDDAERPIGAAWARHVAGYGYVDDDTPELGIAVVSERRGTGVGAVLLESLLDAQPRMSLSVDLRNPAKRLYERLGFELVRIDGEHSAVMLRSGE